MSIVKIRNLNKIYHLKTGDLLALDNVSLDIEEGEIYGVIGYSGAGKSTLVRCINLLERPDSGLVEVADTTLVTTKEGAKRPTFISERELNKQRKQIGMIFQHFNLLERSTVFDNIAYPLRYTGKSRKEIKERVNELLKLVDLEDKSSVYPSQLSGGQKQRVAIARALANNPKILLSDEATSALDPEATESILQLLQKLNKELGLTIVLITHEMSVIKTVCDRVAVMENGKVVEMGDTYKIFSAPLADITKKFVASTGSNSHISELLTKKDEILAGRKNGKLYQLQFTRDSLSTAAVSRISREYNVDLDILLANIELLRGGALGKMLVAASGEQEDLDRAFANLRSDNVEIKEVTEDGIY